jgi:hypothetical protein
MEDLFSTQLDVNHQNITYHVIFDKERYTFVPQGAKTTVEPFSFIREHDEWHVTELLDPTLKAQAIEALDRYLFRQH